MFNLYSLHVSGSYVPIIRRINCINTTSVICHSVQMTVWCAGLHLHTKLTCKDHKFSLNIKLYLKNRNRSAGVQNFAQTESWKVTFK
jgi:hypothetical protein